MSIILHFPKQPVSQSGQPREFREKCAQILFFTGVRIERHTEEDIQQTTPRRGGATGGRRRRKA